MIDDDGKAEGDRLDLRQDVKQALRNLGVEVQPVEHLLLRRRDWLVLLSLASGLVATLAVRHLSGSGRIVLLPGRSEAVEQVLLGGGLFCGVLLLASLTEYVVVAHLEDDASRFNLSRLNRLVAALALALIGPSLLFENWYTAAFSLGLVSVVLGFALQAPVTSFIGWLYIIGRSPFRVGDRIMIGDAAGDVIDIGYLDTTLWEFGGPYLSTDHPSGRIVRLPNSGVLSLPIYNYSWALFPYIWDEVKFNVAYDSDLEFVTTVLMEVATAEIGEEMLARVRQYRDVLAKTPVDEIQVHETPVVFLRVGENTWLEVIVRYLVEPKEAGRVKSALVKDMLLRLNAAPDRVRFPLGASR